MALFLWRLHLVVAVGLALALAAAAAAIGTSEVDSYCASTHLNKHSNAMAPLLSATEEAALDGEQRDEWEARKDLAACYRLAARFGFSDIVWNHITVRVGRAPTRRSRSSTKYLAHQMGLMFTEVTASNLLLFSADGRVIQSSIPQVRAAVALTKGRPTYVDFFTPHKVFHEGKLLGSCVMHAHPENVVALR